MTKYWSPAAIRALARERFKQETKDQPTPVNLADLTAPKDEFLETDIEAPEIENTEENSLEAQSTVSSGDLSYWSQFVSSLGNRVIAAYSYFDRDKGEEITRLCETMKLEVGQALSYRVPEPDHGTYVGSGFIGKLRVAAKQKKAGAIVIDAPLTPSQMKNIEKELKLPVVDRESLILSIFQAHARTRQAQLQVELAQMKYLLPRLSHLWLGLSRTRGARGGLKGRGLGETRLELDRRIVKKRIQFLSERIESFDKVFEVQAARRRNLPRVALVGYTNAGKSSLMKRLTKVPVQVEDKLFCTLDTTVRPLNPPTEPRILLSDTVGFLKKLPHDLVASFRSTLAEARESRLLLHVIDVSHPLWLEHFETTESVLTEVGCGNVKRLLVLNKYDELPSAHLLRAGPLRRLLIDKPEYVGVHYISALTGQGVPGLVDRVRELCSARVPEWIQSGTR